MRRFAPNLMLGSIIVLTLVCVSIAGAFWTPIDPLKLNFSAKLIAPGGTHLLGTDEYGRDVLSRLMRGASASVWVSLLTVTFATVTGSIFGILSGYHRGWLDRTIMAVMNALQAFPGILLALGLIAVIGANLYGIILALGIAFTPSVARVVRGNVMSIREREYVLASRTLGNSELFTMLRHVFPNCIAPITVMATSMFGWVLLAESSLSFLGLGVPPPEPTWGNMLAASRPYIGQAAWLAVLPGLCISMALLGINLLGDALRDRLDPRMRGIR